MKSKTKIMTIAAASLACIAVAGVGFASWVITATQDATVNGSIDVETVDDDRIELTAVITNTPINFTYQREGTHTGDWLTSEANDPTCNLTATITLTVKGANNASGVKINFATNDVTDSTGAAIDNPEYTSKYASESYAWLEYVNGKTESFADAVSNGFITGPVFTYNGTAYKSGDVIPLSTENMTETMSIVISFGWGERFKPSSGTAGVNPADYFNNQDYTTELGDQASDYLTYLNNCLDSVTYSVTLTPQKTSTT